MLFRNSNGKLIEIKRENYTTDTNYYDAILKIHDIKIVSKQNNTQKNIINFINS